MQGPQHSRRVEMFVVLDMLLLVAPEKDKRRATGLLRPRLKPRRGPPEKYLYDVAPTNCTY
jgi:hypothetical protein